MPCICMEPEILHASCMDASSPESGADEKGLIQLSHGKTLRLREVTELFISLIWVDYPVSGVE